jgi:tyrosyl-tRNA synthetase
MHEHSETKMKILLERGVENIFPSKDFLASKLKSGEKLTLYTGYDPTGPSLHIGHAITLMKLRDFQELGHKVIMLIGDFTAMIGDPTDKGAARVRQTREEVLENCKLYQQQAGTLLRFDGENPAELRFNNDWLGKLTFAEVVDLASHFTVQQMLERDMFKRRMSLVMVCDCGFENILPGQAHFQPPSNTIFNRFNYKCQSCDKSLFGPNVKVTTPSPVYLHEFLYPLMQGYDSVAMDVDGEVGGNDQTFNMLAGRDLIKDVKNKEKFVVATKLLVDASGKKMGKSEGNMIALSDSPEDMFGKVMRWSDDMIIPGFEICTRVPIEEVTALAEEMKLGANPRDFKLTLAYHITEMFLGDEAARQGRDHFSRVIQSSEQPVDIQELTPTAYDIVTVLKESGFVSSNSDARRAIQDGGVKVNEVKVTSHEQVVAAGDVVQKGKRFFVKIV